MNRSFSPEQGQGFAPVEHHEDQDDELPNPGRRGFLRAALLAGAVENLAEAAQKKKGKKKGAPGAHRITPLQRQYNLVEAEHLPYMQDERQMREALANYRLVELPNNNRITYDPHLKAVGDFELHGQKHRKYDRQYCTPEVRQFLLDITEKFFQDFPQASQPLVVTSAVRPHDTQAYIKDEGISKTAVATSVHETGATIDLAHGIVSKKYLNGWAMGKNVGVGKAKKFIAESIYSALTPEQDAKLYGHLLNLQNVHVNNQPLILVRRELNERVYHILVSQAYLEWRKTNRIR